MQKTATQLALENALTHGKAELKPIMNKLIPKIKNKKKIPEISKKVKKIVAEINKLSKTERTKRLKKINPGFFKPKKKIKKKIVDLPNVKKKFRVRFPPSASGPLHLGHALIISLNKIYAKKYGGKFILRIEDTNPNNNFKEFYKLIQDDVKWLIGKPDETYIQSSRMKLYYQYANKLLKKGHLYVCDCEHEEFKKLTLKGEKCPCREINAESNLKKWADMKKGKYAKGEVAVRVKTNLKLKNPALKEWVALRISKEKHPKVGTRYKVWPTMNFAVAIDDYEMKLTHVIRGKDHEDNTKKQKMIYDFLGWKSPEYIHLGRINFKGAVLSATDIREGVKDGTYSGYDDPNIETLSSLRKRGIKPKSLLKFFYEIGPTKRDKTVSKSEFYKTLKAFNK